MDNTLVYCKLNSYWFKFFFQNRGLHQINGMNAIEAFPGLRGFHFSESRIFVFQNRGLHGLRGLTRILRVWYSHV